MKAQWLTKENKLDEALDRAKAAVAADPQSATAHFALAVVHDRRREVADATKSYSEVLRLNPRATAAQVALSRLSLTSGDDTAALRYAEEARRSEPSNPGRPRGAGAEPHCRRKSGARGNRNRRACSSRRQTPPWCTRSTERSKRARAMPPRRGSSFERALELSPGFLEALGGLTYLDLQAKAPAQAIARLEPEIAKQPTKRLRCWRSLARAHAAAATRRRRSRRFVARCPSIPAFMPGYSMLAQLYMQQRRIDEARAEFEGIVQRDPSAVGARTMVGMLLEAQGKRDDARKSYEATVSGTENAPVAANNLAFIYAEQGTNLDVALQLATSAKQGLPDDPSVDDTLGWVYYKKDLPSLAVRPLEDSLKKRPDAPWSLYHLGLTYAKLGDKAKAREALERALKLDPKVGGDEARRVLASVSQ